MTNSEELSSSDGLASMISAKVTEVNGDFGSGSANNFSNSAILSSQNSFISSSASGNLGIGNRKKSVIVSQTNESDGVSYPIPFSTICGEKILQLVPTSEGILVISNYRIYIQGKETHFNIPLGLVDQVDFRDIFYLHINCKDARCIRTTFSNNETIMDVMRKFQQVLAASKNLEECFAFSFYDKVESELSDEMKLQLGSDLPPCPTPKDRFDAEIKRMEFNVQNPWRISTENEDYELCSSYPKHIIVPNSIDKKKLEQVACFRSARRFPAVVWRHRGNGAVICRCSQPEVGWFGWRSTEDEELVQNIIQACAYQCYDRSPNIMDSQSVPLDSLASSPSNFGGGSSIELVPESVNPVKKLLILDARSYTTAVANRARGGGCECLEYYPNCEIQFMNLANIHSIRKSFINLRQLCSLPSDQANWFSQLEGCKWLQHMSGLMKAAVTVVTAIENDGRPVMVHCSDGWDRTPQIVALAEILLDPFYRSLEGFEILVEREWLDFGHKFGDRCGQGVGSEDGNERCPVFLQWLDCLHQLIRQFPTAFEFNLSYLVKLVQHTYSNLFGTFLCNTTKERELHEINRKTISVWKFLRAPRNYDKFRNSLFKSCDKVLWPSCEVRDLGLWSQVYLGYENPPPLLTEVINPSQESSPAPSVAEGDTSDSTYLSLVCKGKSTSYENLAKLHFSKGHQRKMSDTSIYGPDSEAQVNKDIQPKVSETETVLNLPYKHTNTNQQVAVTHSTNSEVGDTSENEKDNEPNSEDCSESTVISAHKLNFKSIESSTDSLESSITLVADTGVSGKLTRGNTIGGDFEVATFNGHDEFSGFEMKNIDEDLINSIEISLLTSNLNDLAPQSESEQTHRLDVPTKPFVVDEIDDVYGAENFSGHHCTVCEQTKAILRLDENHYNIPLNGSGNPSSSSVGINYYTGFNGNGSANVFSGVPNFLVKDKQVLDVDGLTHFHDEIQVRLNAIRSEYLAQIEALQRDVHIYRNALRGQLCHSCSHCGSCPIPDGPEDSVSISGSEVISHSSGASSSFEVVEHVDTFPPLWVPDFASNSCTDCSIKFSLGRRKHHCRACGRIYCSDCSENSIPLPHEQIFGPARVCRTCFNKFCPEAQHPSSVQTENITNGIDSSTISGTSKLMPASNPIAVPYSSPIQVARNLHVNNLISKSKQPRYSQQSQRGQDCSLSNGVNGTGQRSFARQQ